MSDSRAFQITRENFKEASDDPEEKAEESESG